MNKTQKEQVLLLAKKKGVLRPKDLDIKGLAREYLNRLCKEGLLERRERGIYVIPKLDLGEYQQLIEACKKVPSGIICLLSALQFHEVTTQSPHKIWMAVKNNMRAPKSSTLPLHIIRYSGKAFESGIETYNIKGATLRVYSLAKTVADCFKHRNKIGIDVAIEALRESRRTKKCSIDDLWFHAKICRVSNVIKPYMEMLT